MLNLMLGQVEDQIKAQELKASQNKRMSARLKADLDAGRNPRLAVQKEKSRQRAAKHRLSMRAEQAKKRLSREEALERFNVPEKARKQDQYLLIPGAGSKTAAPPSRKEKAMVKGKAEDREFSGTEVLQDDSRRPGQREVRGKARRATEKRKERGEEIEMRMRVMVLSRLGPYQTPDSTKIPEAEAQEEGQGQGGQG